MIVYMLMETSAPGIPSAPGMLMETSAPGIPQEGHSVVSHLARLGQGLHELGRRDELVESDGLRPTLDDGRDEGLVANHIGTWKKGGRGRHIWI